MWQRSFVAVSVLVGETLDDAIALLPAGSDALLGDLPEKLRDPRRTVRATALAKVAEEVTLAIDEVTLR